MDTNANPIKILIHELKTESINTALGDNKGDKLDSLDFSEIGEAMLSIATSKKYINLLADSGISSNNGFFSELFKKIGNKILPEIIENEELTKDINTFFYKKNDYLWLSKIPNERLAEIFLKTKWSISPTANRYIQKEILNVVIILAQKIASIGIEKEVVSKIANFDDLDSPFIGLNRETTILVEKILKNPDQKKTEWEGDYKQVLVMLKQCELQIVKLYIHKDKYGISLKMTILIRKLEKYIMRLENLLLFISTDKDKEKSIIAARILKELVYTQNTKYSIRKHFSSSLEFISFKIVENTSKSGENYIAATTYEYWKLFRKALGGGIIVAFLCWFKTSIYFLNLPSFWIAFFYSLNYAMGFVLIHILRFTLATKQPAMTASTIAESLSNNGKKVDWLNGTTKLLTRQIRSQFISLVGNATIAFPIAIGIGWSYFFLTGNHIATPEKAAAMIKEINLLQSPAIFHAAIAGVYLMLSGLVSGYYENLWIYHNYHKRISQNPNLTKLFGQQKLSRFTDYIGNNIGGISGNIFLGIMLGSTSTFGKSFGILLDIRHVTFASGNFGIAFSSLNYHLDQRTIWYSVAGIVVIGLINVLVSFGLSITIALLSRGTNFKEIKQLIFKLLKQFIFEGITFIYPSTKIKNQKESE
jgi:site-specific recombinase